MSTHIEFLSAITKSSFVMFSYGIFLLSCYFPVSNICVVAVTIIISSHPISIFHSGLVIDSGEEMTHAVPVFSGYAIPEGVMGVEMGGKHVTQCLK